MHKAQHDQILQNANQGLVEIRKLEIDHSIQVNAALGTQSALIIGFVYLTFSQNIENNYSYTSYVNAVYYVMSAITMALATNVILSTMLITLLGPGLALNGPIGSMAKATDGMKLEQFHIVYGFLLMMISFSITTVLLFWVTMDFYSSVISTIVFLVAARYWAYFCWRIYHRFHWDRVESAKMRLWSEERGRDSSDEPMAFKRQNTAQQQQQLLKQQQQQSITGHISTHIFHCDVESSGSDNNIGSGKNSVEEDRRSFYTVRASLSGAVDSLRNSFIKPSSGGNISSKNIPANKGVSPPNQSTATSKAVFSSNPKDTLMEGYITMNLVSELKAKHWERRYVVLNYRGQLTYYKNRQDFRTEPTKSRLNPRPLELDEYFITFSKQEHVDDNSTLSSANQNGDVDGLRVKFIFNLTRKDDPAYTAWHYRSDTEEELDMWVAAMKVVSPTSFKTESIA